MYAVKAILPSSLWLTNSSSLIKTLQADFADGLGLRTLTKDQTYNLSYSSGGTKTWTFKLTLTSGTVLQSQTDFVFDSTGNDFAKNYKSLHSGSLCSINKWDRVFNMPNGYTDTAHAVTADASYYGQTASGWYTIHYANSDGILRHPLILAEGFDPDDVLKPEEQFGGSNISTFITQVSSQQASNKLYNLLLNPSTESYDIVYVDWKHSGDFIERNALLLEKIIGIINTQSSNAPVVIMGQSMGCLVSRWALRDMENKGVNHHCRMFISFDGPQRGANIPLAFQYLSRQARSLYYKHGINASLNEYNDIATAINAAGTITNLIRSLFFGSPVNYLQTVNTDVIRGAAGLQDQPSVREMLINYVKPNYQVNNTIHNDWQHSLDFPSVGNAYPQGFTGQPCTLVAVANGSECAATQPFSPGQALLSLSGNANTRFLGDVIGMIATPLLPTPFLFKNPSLLLGVLPGKNSFSIQFTLNAQPDGVAVNQYTGKITYTKKLLYLINITNTISSVSVTSSPSILPYDYFPGGQIATGFDLINDVATKNALVKYSLTVSAQQLSFCLTPVPSVLDIGKGQVTLTKADYLTPYIGAQPPSNPKSTPFSGGYTTAFDVIQGSANNNEHHLLITNLNGDWIYNQIMGTPQLSDCSTFCGYNTISINGNQLLCTTGTYNLTGTLPSAANSTITWSTLPSGIANFTTGISGTSVGLAKQTTGPITLTSQIQVKDAYGNTCGKISPYETIQVGIPSISFIRSTREGFSCYYDATVTLAAISTTVEFSLDNVNWTAGTLEPGNVYWAGYDFYGPRTVTVYVRAVNLCGTSTVKSNTLNIPSPPGGCTAISQSARSSDNTNVSLDKISHTNGIKIYPNPTTNITTIELKNSNLFNSNIKQIQIIDETGKQLIEKKFDGNKTNVNLNKLSAGMYFIKVWDGERWCTLPVLKN